MLYLFILAHLLVIWLFAILTQSYSNSGLCIVKSSSFSCHRVPICKYSSKVSYGILCFIGNYCQLRMQAKKFQDAKNGVSWRFPVQIQHLVMALEDGTMHSNYYATSYEMQYFNQTMSIIQLRLHVIQQPFNSQSDMVNSLLIC